MLLIMRLCYGLTLLLALLLSLKSFAAPASLNIPILCYHNFNPTVPGSMNMTPQKMESQVKWLKDNGYTVIPLQEAVAYLLGKRDTLPRKAVVITADDGWQSAYTYLYPVIKKYKIPVTLFIYPQTISVGKHVLTWEELKTLQQTGLFDIQGHTYWHPNFNQEKKHLTPEQYAKLVTVQLVRSKKLLERKLGKPVTLLAWPFGIYDSYLEQQAKLAGYVMAFSIDDERANRKFRQEAQPRFLLTQSQSVKSFMHIVGGASANATPQP